MHQMAKYMNNSATLLTQAQDVDQFLLHALGQYCDPDQLLASQVCIHVTKAKRCLQHANSFPVPVALDAKKIRPPPGAPNL